MSSLFVLLSCFLYPTPLLAEFSHLGFTYTTYIAVKEEFLISKLNSKNKKVKKLGCAIYMKEYTIMMYLASQVARSYN